MIIKVLVDVDDQAAAAVARWLTPGSPSDKYFSRPRIHQTIASHLYKHCHGYIEGIADNQDLRRKGSD